MMSRARKRAREKGIPFDLTQQYIVNLLATGRCHRTGIEWQEERGDFGAATNPWAPSLDRRDSSEGYVFGNVDVVVWAFNRAKSDWSEEVFDHLARSYVKHTEDL